MMRFALFLLSTFAIAGDFTTSLGDTYPYMISAITTDSAGNTYVVGSRMIAILTGAFRIGTDGTAAPLGSPATDVFVSKLDPNGRLLFTDTFAGKGVDTGTAIALDPSGNIYIAGTTTSNDFPLSKALQTQPSPYGSGFVMKLSNDGSTILYSTYFGGTLGTTSISSLATDSKGNLYLTGSTSAADFPHTAGMPFGAVQPGQYTRGAIIASISAAGDRILYSGALFGSPPPAICPNLSNCQDLGEQGASIGVDAAGNAYIVGNGGDVLPATTGALSTTGADAFVAKINAGGTGLGYLTYLSRGNPYAFAIAVDASGNAYIGGSTEDPNFPTTPGSYRSSLGASGVGGFLAKLNPLGSAFVWATYLGDTVQSIAVDASGNVWAVGSDIFSTLPNEGWSSGREFVAGLNSAGSKLIYSATYPLGTVGQFAALDPSGLVHVAGASGFVSAINPNAAPSMKIFDFGNAFGGAATARIAPAEVISIYGPGIGPATAASAVPVNGFYPKTFAGVQVQINGMNMPLLYVSANQINAVVPMEVSTGAGATVRVVNGTAVSPAYPVWIVDSAPMAYPTVLNQDGTINSYSNRAKFNSIVTFYVTGWQSSFYPLADGQVAAIAKDACLSACQVSVQTGRFPWIGTVLYGGAAPGIVAGVTQFNINVGLSPGILSGPYTFQLTGPSTTLSLGIWIDP
jgi:uncharacterized protein (TIGR03437 family)